MKKYILSILVSSIIGGQINIAKAACSYPQDSTRIYKEKLNVKIDDPFNNHLSSDVDGFSAMNSFNIAINIDSITTIAMNSVKDAKRSLQVAIDKQQNSGFSYNSYIIKTTNQRPIVHTEKKTFSNVSAIEVFHKYGDIVIRESNSKQVELEIQYLNKNNRNESKISVVNRLLSIKTEVSGKNRGNSQINYILNIPRHTSVNVNLDYGDIKIDQMRGALMANLSYSKLSAQKIANDITLKSRYGDVIIGEISNAIISGSYSNIKIQKANNIAVSGSYNDYRFDNLQNLSMGKSTSYGNCRIGIVGSIRGTIMYTDLFINELQSDASLSSLYGDVQIRAISPRVKNVNIKGNYCDISLGLQPDQSVQFDTSLNYGDLTISKKHVVRYTDFLEKGPTSIKKGQMGKGVPSTNIIVSNNYADVEIK